MQKKDATINVQSNADDKFIYIQVEDNGPGIPEEIRKNLFQSFAPKDNSYGLFLCKNIVDRHKGKIKLVDSMIGTKLEISLPVTL
ncbi:MAG: HAMP domain-containing histidine kinase [Ignavibacterium sp.]|nr:HAMP domain-containing histidine kinase [Ignavibacterium sp.]